MASLATRTRAATVPGNTYLRNLNIRNLRLIRDLELSFVGADAETGGRGGIKKAADLYDRDRFEQTLPSGPLKLPATWLSHGYQASLAWLADLVGHYLLDFGEELPPEVQPEHMEGLVLIDELDLYLHPQWQAGLVRALKLTFPRMQFVATTHSPILLNALHPASCGYWWLAWSWDNLLFSCGTCNSSARKGNHFALEQGSVPLVPEQEPPGDERPMFIDPTREDPLDHIVFTTCSPASTASVPRSGWATHARSSSNGPAAAGVCFARRTTSSTPASPPPPVRSGS